MLALDDTLTVDPFLEGIVSHDLAEDRWRAVAARDRRHDGTFVYAVSTTGVYCRPSCPARRPLRENVSFFETAATAEQAGYRPCRRCRPHSADGTSTERSVRAARAFLDSHEQETVSLAQLAREVGLSPWHLQRAFTRLVGLSPKAYQNMRRGERLRANLRDGETVSRATYGAGFGSSSRVYARAGGDLGMTPGAYRRGALGETIRYGITPTAIGRLLVAATERGVVGVTLGDSDRALTDALKHEFPSARILRDDDTVGPWTVAIVTFIEGKGTTADVPLDLHGTAFQVRVWQALRDIPIGSTSTYSDIASAIGQPRAVRAVARACATNPVALVVPCHRVVRRDGKLGGYRWGDERKRRILENERAAITQGASETRNTRRP